MNALYMVGNTHFDPAWLWTWDEALASIRATFRAALERMREDDGFIYSFCTPAVFEWIEKTDPELFGEIVERAREGRWDVEAEGWWLQPDCNLPCGESLIRQGLYGQAYIASRFGRRASTVFNIDSFGHSAMLPQILKKCGLRYYVFSRPSEGEMALADDLFTWRAPDGSGVLAWRAGDIYSRELAESLSSQREKLKGCGRDAMLVYGVSDHGGAPTKKAIADIRAAMAERGDVGVRFAAVGDFFSAQEGRALPEIEGELQTRFYGPFSNRAAVKRDNRRAEYCLLNAEKAAFLSQWLCERPYPAEALRQCWRDLLFNQFHDILGGACIPEVFEDARNLHGRAMQCASEILHFSLQDVCRRVRTVGNNEDSVWNVCLFNLSCAPYRGLVEAEVQWAWEFPWYSAGMELVDETGAVREAQIIDEKSAIPGFRSRFAFEAEVPALGYRLYAARRTGRPAVRDIADSDVDSPFALRVYEDAGDVWCFNTADGYGAPCEEPALISRRTVENGALRTTVKRAWRFRDSIFEEYITSYPNDPQVDYRYSVRWNERHLALKLIPTRSGGARAITAAVPCGSVRRPADGREYPVGEWLSWGEGRRGATLLIDGAFAYDTGADGDVRLTLLRSPIYGDLRIGELDERRDYKYMEQGIVEGRVRLIPRALTPSEASVLASQWNCPPIVVCEANHGGELPPTFAGIAIEGGEAVAGALKRAEDGDGFILRLTEHNGRSETASVRLADFETAKVALAPYEIKTVRFSAGGFAENNMLEEPIDGN